MNWEQAFHAAGYTALLYGVLYLIIYPILWKIVVWWYRPGLCEKFLGHDWWRTYDESFRVCRRCGNKDP